MRAFGWTMAVIGGVFGFWMVIVAVQLIALPMHAVNNTVSTAHGVVDRTMNPDNALMQYRWFHDADGRLQTMPAQIQTAKDALDDARKNDPSSEQARYTEYTGLKQNCMNLVGQYNSRSQRIDAGFFRNPERYLPVSSSTWQPLPQGYSTTWCEGA